MKLLCTHNRDDNSIFPQLVIGKIYDCQIESIGCIEYAIINEKNWTPIRFFKKVKDNRNKKIDALLLKG